MDMDVKYNLIAVMGPSGAGKTTFINAVSNSNLPVGSGLEPCTKELQLSLPFEMYRQRFQFIDTPGDEDNNTLRVVSEFLTKNEAPLAGVLYFQSISNPRVGGLSRRNMRIFHDLCGDAAMNKVAIIVTGSDPLSDVRELELRESPKFFRSAIQGGAQFFRFNGTTESARQIVSQMVDISGEEKLALRIQEELRNAGGKLSKTTAAVQLESQLIGVMREYEEVVEELQVADDIGAAKFETLSTELEEIQAEMAITLAEKDQLANDYMELESILVQGLTLKDGLILYFMLFIAYWLL
ncbi:hypothetical protein GYMLUDRAFT_981606 [Collybiopsis luxurians FD-317 M1]|uniref:G domain-containing protein n=1 Tax=Collybiopsis luxurians FD-317 M1 TaxID=944289 RepID=A0A0D0C973_9AGAR|nr:hypothetical protein GYMLUDRAFT_981606 [Collybiopsis luxurians FD-317 M1]